MENTVIHLIEPWVQIVKRNAGALSDVLQSKFRCNTSIDGVDLGADSGTVKQKRAAVPPEKRCEWTLRSGVTVSVCKADLTTLQVDAVVNAANESLDHCGGLALALSRAGGPEIQKESKILAPLRTGDAVVTGAGRLPCNKIIHAVGPKVFRQSDLKNAEPLLERAIRSILRKVEEDNLLTVAIPAISSGLFGYPLQQCAVTIVHTIIGYYDTSSFTKHLPTEILLANHDDPSVLEMEKACKKLLGPHVPMSYSQAASNKTRGSAGTVTPTLQLKNVHVTLMRGNIEEQQTDVIVNTAGVGGHLSSGQVSKALLKEDGPQMQKEMNAAISANHGPVIVTKAHQLRCKEVYHTFCHARGTPGSEKLLYDSVKECLWMAQRDHRSIALPAIGTGALGFSKEEVAATMLNTVAELDQTFKKTMEVHFVIYPSDHGTFQAFEKKMKSLQSKVSYSTPAREDTSGSRSSGSGPPRIVLTGPGQESNREAEKWLVDLLSKSHCTIHNNFIQHLNDEEHKQLTRLKRSGVTIEEFFSRGHACISLEGKLENVAAAALQVEVMLCRTQERFVNNEQEEMTAKREVLFERLTIERSSKEFSNVASAFRRTDLVIKKVEKVENSTLKRVFDLKGKQLQSSTTQTMYHCIPAQFCTMVCQVGFHKECAPPEDSDLGEGIYFASSMEKAMEVWNCKQKQEEYLYFVEAEVLRGTSAPGRRGLVIPPATENDPRVLHDSVEGPGVSVIFSGYQALPKYIITCRKW